MKTINSKKIFSIIIIFIGIIFAVVFGTEMVLRYVLFNIRDEIIPFAGNNTFFISDIVDEIMPMFTMSKDIPGEEKQFVEGEYSEYTWDMEAQASDDNSEKTAMNDSCIEDARSTATDATMVADIAKREEAATAFSVSDIGIAYTMEQLSDYSFLLSNCYNVDSSTSVNPDELDAFKLLNMDMSVDMKTPGYKVLIYHTHGSEAFADSKPNETSDTVIGVGDELARLLTEKYGVEVYHNRSIYDKVNGTVDRSKAYDRAGADVDAILAEYPTIEVVIDLHRDGVREDLHLVSDIDGKQTAKIMFVNGVSRLNIHGDIDYLYNPNKLANLAFSLKLHLAGKKKYGDLMRNIYISGYRYNLDKKPKAALIEVGAQTNTVQEVKNAMEPLADIIYQVITE